MIPVHLDFSLTGDLVEGETVSFYMPGFSTSTSALWLSGSDASSLLVHWEEATSTLTLTVVVDIIAGSVVEVTVNNLRTPVNGVSVQESHSFTIASTAAAAPVLNVTLDFISTIPATTAAGIEFMAALSSSLERFVDPSFGNNSILLLPGHELNDADIGTTITIENTLYTIKDVNIDVITFEEEYVNTLVAQALPTIHLYTPDARAAYYLNGSLTTELLFRYRVKRGDVSNGLDIHNTSSSIHTSEPFQLLGTDQVLRVSQNPLVPFSQNLPSFDGGSAVNIDSIRPTVVRIDSSSPDGTYAMNQLIDFRITFSYPVLVNLLPGQSPALLLRKVNGDIAIARYYSGIGTDQLSFSYTIKAGDYEYLNSKLVTVDQSYSLVQPLRVIMSNKFQYIRRSAKFPVIDTYPSIPLGGINISSNISWVGDGVYVTSVVAVPSETNADATSSAGDVVFIHVTFSDPVLVQLGDASIDPSQQLKVMLDVGKTSGLPGHATYVNVTDSYTLLFTYTISIEDSLSSENSSLLLACTCSDLYERTFIELYNGTTIVEDSSRGHVASTILAADNEPNSLLLLSPFFIENSQPSVLTVSSNVTAGVYSPGAAILISVHFDRRVSSLGTTRLFLVGDKGGDCVAHLHGGNNTASLHYLYLPTDASRTSAMSCRYVQALDTSYGQVYRYSEGPITPALLDLPLPGSGSSVGIQTKVAIDGTNVQFEQMTTRTTSYSPTTTMTVLPLMDLYIHATADELLHLVHLHNQEAGPTMVEFDASEEELQSKLDVVVEHPLEFGDLMSYSTLYHSLYVRDAALLPFLFAPEVTTTDTSPSIFFAQKHWWSGYDVSNKIELAMEYDRRVVGQNLYLPLNVGASLNVAKVGKETRQWLVSIDLRDLSADEVDINQHQFQIRYGGWLTSCISVGGWIV